MVDTPAVAGALDMMVLADVALKEAVEDAVPRLVSTAHMPEGSYVTTPLLYPSGSSVVVRVSGGQDRFFVTDFGLGRTEAEMMGGERIFSRSAYQIAATAGVGFDQNAFFAIEVARDRIAGAITAIASCSLEAVVMTAFRISERASNAASEVLVDQLEAAFGQPAVLRHDKVIGASNHEWEFSASVTVRERKSLFEVATKHPNSVAAVSTKMNDVARLERAPKRVVMVHRKAEFGTLLGVLSHNASIIEDSISIDQIRRLAA